MTHMIPKVKAPETVKQLRPIIITPFFSKVLEKSIRDHIISDVDKNMHPNQFGSRKAVAATDHLASTLADLAAPSEEQYVTIFITHDFSSLFNRLFHPHVVESAAKLGLRQPLLRLIADYLSNRKTTVKWGDEWSSERPNRGGSGQGTLLSCPLFTISVDPLIKKLYEVFSTIETGIKFKSEFRIYVNDLVSVHHIKKSDCVNGVFTDSDGRVRLGLDIVEQFTIETGMKLNKTKTAALIIDFASKENKIVFPRVVSVSQVAKRSKFSHLSKC